MPLHLWWTYVITTFFISASPGPNMLTMMASGIRHGLRLTFFTMGGCMLAVFLVIGLSVAGVGALLDASPRLFDGLCIAGAAYLIWLGAKSAFGKTKAPIDSETTTEIAPTASPKTHFMSGFKVGISNPKLFLFATAFFPQFIDKSLPELPQIGILLLTGFFIELGWYIAYAAGGSRLSVYLRNPAVQKNFNRATGVLFTGFGIALLALHR